MLVKDGVELQITMQNSFKEVHLDLYFVREEES
jgi:hypothetical protein